MAAHPHDMQAIELLSSDGTTVFPADAMGYRTEDGFLVLGYDYDDATFYLNNGTTRTHGEITFNSFLVPPSKPLPMPAVGRYVTCAVLGDCRVDQISNAAALVRSATRSAVMLPVALTPLQATCVIDVGTLSVLLPDNTAYVLKGIKANGGTMGLIDHIVGLLNTRCGVKISNEAKFYERAELGMLCALRHVRSCGRLLLEVRGNISYTSSDHAPADADGIIFTTAISAVTHSTAMDFLALNPWMLPCTLDDVFDRLGFCKHGAPPDYALVRTPYVLNGAGKLMLVSHMPDCAREPVTVPADMLVHGIRLMRVTARTGGEYSMCYDNGDHCEIVCPTDLHVVYKQLENVAYLCTVIGKHNVREMLPDCPDTLLMERFGSAYDDKTGIYTSA